MHGHDLGEGVCSDGYVYLDPVLANINIPVLQLTIWKICDDNKVVLGKNHLTNREYLTLSESVEI